MQYIGSNKIKKTALDTEKPEEIIIMFTDGTTRRMINELFEKIVMTEEGTGTVEDVIMTVMGREFLAKLASYDLSLDTVERVKVAMTNLTYNLSEELIAKTFDCTGTHDIKLSKIIA
jgi:hypothetical protein